MEGGAGSSGGWSRKQWRVEQEAVKGEAGISGGEDGAVSERA